MLVNVKLHAMAALLPRKYPRYPVYLWPLSGREPRMAQSLYPFLKRIKISNKNAQSQNINYFFFF
jgi:hypothetical protein